MHSVKFVAIAATKPLISKLISLAEQRANPDITGNKLKLTYNPVCSPEKIDYKSTSTTIYIDTIKSSPNRHLEINTVKSGAELFIVSVKLTAT